MKFSKLLDVIPGVLTRPDEEADVIAPVTERADHVHPGGLFITRKGANVDGHDFIPQAVERGAAAVIGERPPSDVVCAVPYAQVGDVQAAIGPLASAYWGDPSRKLIVIGVTGTDGKTTTTTLIHHLLNHAGRRAGMVTSVGAELGDAVEPTGLHVTTPSAPQVHMYLARMLQNGLTHAVIESTSHGLQQGRLGGVAFDAAVMTNLTHEHLDFHGTMEAYRDAKLILFRMVERAERKQGIPKIAVVNVDDPSAVHFMAVNVERHLTYGTRTNALYTVFAHNVQYGPDGSTFTLRLPGGSAPVRFPLVGSFNVANALAASAAVWALGVPVQQIADGLAHAPQIPGRMEIIHENQSFIAAVDFAHTPNALSHVLRAARTMIAPGKRVIVVFGSAGLRDPEKRALMAGVAAKQSDAFVLTAEDPRTESLDRILDTMARAASREGASEGSDFWRIHDRGQAIAYACNLARSGDIVLACGKGHEQSMAFGKIEYPWDDREAMRAALRGTPLLTLPTAERGKEI